MGAVTVTDQRLLRGVSGTIRFINVDAEGDATEAAGTITVGVVDADGATVVEAGQAVTAEGDGLYSLTVAADDLADLTVLTATWTDAGDGSAHTTLIEVCGGHYFSVANLRSYEPSLAEVTKYPAAGIVAARRVVEDECERICGVAFVPRYRRVTLDGSGTGQLLVPDNQLRTVTAALVDQVALTSAELAALLPHDDTTIERPAGLGWGVGIRNVTISYTHGYDRPPAELVEAVKHRTRHVLNRPRSGIPERATSFSVAEGGTYRLDTPDANSTGLPDVDAVYSRYSERDDGTGTPRPASRSFDLDPSRDSVFHGGSR